MRDNYNVKDDVVEWVLFYLNTSALFGILPKKFPPQLQSFQASVQKKTKKPPCVHPSPSQRPDIDTSKGRREKREERMTTATAVLILAVFVVLDLVKYWISEVRER